MTTPRIRETRVTALDTFIKLLRATSSVTSRVHGHLAGEKLTESQFGVLEAISHLGPLCQRELSAKILKTGGNITMVVDNLEKRGLVRRQRDAADRRVVHVHLTPEGKDVIRRVFPRQAESIEQEMGLLSDEEQVQLGALCKKLGLRLGRK